MRKTDEEKLAAMAGDIAKLTHLAQLQQQIIEKLGAALAGHQAVIQTLDKHLQASASRPQNLGSSLN